MDPNDIPANFKMPQSITFVVREEPDGGYSAAAVGEGIFTQGDDYDHLVEMVREALRCHFEPERPVPELVHLHFVRDEVIAA